MKKSYPLEIKNVSNDSCCILMSKGHHDVNEFKAAVIKAGYNWNMGEPQHCWFKATPSSDQTLLCSYHQVKEGTRGSFPATCSWEE